MADTTHDTKDSKESEDDSSENSDTNETQEAKIKRIKQLSMVVCICKGIPLKKVLPALVDSETVQDVNAKAGTGSGGCQGQRCGPRIKSLLKKFHDQNGGSK